MMGLGGGGGEEDLGCRLIGAGGFVKWRQRINVGLFFGNLMVVENSEEITNFLKYFGIMF
jgi:hypothetical protein